MRKVVLDEDVGLRGSQTVPVAKQDEPLRGETPVGERGGETTTNLMVIPSKRVGGVNRRFTSRGPTAAE
jgi:hypothetical protein